MVENGKYYVLNGGKEPSGYTNSWNTPESTITISEGGNSCGFVNYNEEKFWSGGTVIIYQIYPKTLMIIIYLPI